VYDRHAVAAMSRSITRLTLPVLVEQFFLVFMGAVNTLLVANIGREAISATGNVDTISNIIISVFSALAVGGTVIVAQCTGRQDLRIANKAAAQALLASLTIAGAVSLGILLGQRPLVQLLFRDVEPLVLQNTYTYLSIVLWSYLPIAVMTMAFGILRGSGDTRTPMAISIVMNIINVLISYVLIYGVNLHWGLLVIKTAGYGVRGAAIGLTLARLLGMVLALVPLLRGSHQIRIDWQNIFRFDGLMQRSILNLGIPAGTEQLMFNGGKLIVQTFIIQIGTVALAANSIANSVAGLATIPGLAMSLSITALVGQAIGSGDKPGARRLLKFSLLYNTAALTVLSVIFLIFLHPIIGLYTHDQETARVTYTLMFGYLVAQPLFWTSSFELPSGLRGAGDVRYTLIVSIISMWILRILLGYLFAIVLHIGVLGIWLAMFTDWAFRALMFIRRLQGDSWLNQKTI
jgi:putative MATE family efflux protein